MTSTHSIFKEFDDSMQTMIKSISNNNPAPIWGKILRVSEDHTYVDVKISGGVLHGVKAWGYPIIDTMTVLIFMNGEHSQPLALCDPKNILQYEDNTPTLNKLSNGTFYAYKDDKFTGWTGGHRSSKGEAYYGETTCYLQANETLTSTQVNISDLRGNEADLTVIMIYYLWKGGGLTLTTHNQNNKTITYAPENLEITTEVLDPTNEWKYNRTVFLLRNNTDITLTFKNNTNMNTYIDGVRIWTQDFNSWYPSQEDKKQGVTI